MSRIGWIVLAVAPWFALVPWGASAVHVMFGAVALLAALHGLGRGLAFATRATVDPILAAVWGLAVATGVTGALAAAHLATRDVTRGLALAGIAFHTLFALRDAARPAASLSGERLHVSPFLALIGAGSLLILGLAGDPGQRTFDDETNHRAQVARLHATGGLDDGLGLPRHAQLGGQIALESIWASLDRVEHLPALDGGVCFVLALALVLARLGLRSRSRALWGLLVIVASTAATFGPLGDPSARWSAIALMLGLFVTLDDREHEPPPVPIGLLVGALATLRHELIPVAAIVLIGSSWSRRSARDRWLVVIGAIVAVAPFVVARLTAGLSAAPFSTGDVPLRILLFAAVALPVAPVLGAIFERSHRIVALASLAGIAGIVSELAGDRPYATRFLWPIVIALLLYIVIAAARRSELSSIGYVAAFVACLLVVQGREATARARWSRRISDVMIGVGWVHAAPADDGASARYAWLLAKVRPGARVVAWVREPEYLPWQRTLHDARTPELALLRDPRWPGRIAPLLTSLDADYLLFEADRTSPCGAACEDEVTRFARELPLVADDHGVVLVEIR